MNRTHGNSKHPLYKTWLEMHARCESSKKWQYKYYGGRGIVVCPRWGDFTKFVADMGDRPLGKTLDRENKDGNYEPGNCRWADRFEQANNASHCRILLVNGEQVTMSIAARRAGLSVQLVQKRLDVLGWDETRAATQPAAKCVRKNARIATR